MKITTIGIDMAENVFQLHGVDARGKTALNKPLKRAQMAAFFADLPPRLVGMEACAGALANKNTSPGRCSPTSAATSVITQPHARNQLQRYNVTADANPRLLRRARNDGNTGETVVGKACLGRSTSSARFR